MIKRTKSKKVVSESFEPFFSLSILKDIWFSCKLRQLIAIRTDHIDGYFLQQNRINVLFMVTKAVINRTKKNKFILSSK